MVFIQGMVFQAPWGMDYENSETQPTLQSKILEYAVWLFLFMTVGCFLTVPIGMAEIFVLNYLLGVFEPHCFIAFHDSLDTFLQSAFSAEEGMDFAIIIAISAVLGSLTVLVFFGGLEINDKDTWWNGLSKEEKEKIQKYWTSFYRHNPK